MEYPVPKTRCLALSNCSVLNLHHQMQMALFTSNPISTQVPIPAKFNTLILRTPCLILSPCAPRPSSVLSAKRLSQSAFANPVRASSPRQYVYPDPIPEFAKAETRKFRAELVRKLLEEEEAFGVDLDTVVDVCAEIFSEYLHKEYGGPGTLLVEPFTIMLVALNERKLPGAPLAARASLLWAQNYVDKDWKVWNSTQRRDFFP